MGEVMVMEGGGGGWTRTRRWEVGREMDVGAMAEQKEIRRTRSEAGRVSVVAAKDDTVTMFHVAEHDAVLASRDVVFRQ